jgi:3-carboxy-cis,cis-muconate cycloisomerase
VLQFGGAAGTLAPLGGQGIAVEAELARRLDLRVPLMPWHTQRDNLAELGGWLALVTGSLGKMGQDIILLTQTEVGEVRESTDPMRGGSSTMPQKSNPITSELIVAAARHNASLLSSMHQALLQEHERATHGWHLEWITLPQMLMVTAAAARKAAFLTESLEVRADRMQENIRRSNGLIYAEAISFALSGLMPRAEAQRIVKESCAVTVETSRNLFDVLKEKLGDTATIDRAQFEGDEIYLGSSQAFIDRVLVEADTI